MDPLGIIDRRRLRRKLTFWRIAAFGAALLLVTSLVYSSNWITQGMRDPDHVARVEISGVITADEELLARLAEIRDDDAVKAVIVAIESPGGTTYGGERIFNAIREVAAAKPVAAEVRGLAASAGYMVASATDYIVAGEASIVGSIGVIFQFGNVSRLLDRIGVSVDAVKSTPLKAEPSPFEPTDPEAVEMIERLVADSYDWFIDIVVERRDFSRQEALALADGSIFTGRQAFENGLIDELGGEEEIMTFFEERGIPAGLTVIEWRKKEEGGWLFGRAAGDLLVALISEYLPIDKALGELTTPKLFLDGLVSVWQFDGGQARDDWGKTP